MDINLTLDPSGDNYTTLRDALAMAAGGRLIIRSGRYPVAWLGDRPALRIPDGCEVSAESVTLQCSSANPTLFAMFVIEADDVDVCGLSLIGDRRQQAWSEPSYWCLLAVRQAARVSLKRVKVSQSQKFGLDASDVIDFSLTRCQFTENGYAEQPPDNQPLKLCGGLRIAAEIGRNSNVQLIGCLAERNGGQGANIGRVDNLVVDGCRLSRNGLYAGHGNQDGLALSGIIGGVVKQTQAALNQADGIVLSAESPAHNCADMQLRANRARGNGGNGILLYEHDTPNGGNIYGLEIARNVCADNGQMSAGWPWGFSGIRLGARGFGRIHDICLRANTCLDTRPPAQRTQMCGIDMLPRETNPRGGLGENIELIGNRCSNNAHYQVNLWQIGQIQP